MIRWTTLCLLALLFAGRPICAEELTIDNELKMVSSRLIDESIDFVTTPFTIKDGNLLWTLGIAGTIGLTYIYDHNIHDKLQGSARSRAMDRASDAGELIGNPYLHLGMAALVYGGGVIANSTRWKETGEMMGEALILADAATLLIKEGTGRGRPSVTSGKDDFRPFQFKSGYDSFPSMHTASSFALASVIARTSDSLPVAVISYSTAAFVGFSRTYQNKHWASDVLLAAAIGELAGRIVTSYHANKNRRLAVLPTIGTETVTMNLLYRF